MLAIRLSQQGLIKEFSGGTSLRIKSKKTS